MCVCKSFIKKEQLSREDSTCNKKFKDHYKERKRKKESFFNIKVILQFKSCKPCLYTVAN